MAGRLKHMERSHRSHRRDAAIFSNFNRHAYKVSVLKEQRQTLGQRFASLLNPLKSAMRSAADR